MALFLASSGADKWQITVFYCLNAIAGALISMVVGPAVRRNGYQRWHIVACCAISAVGYILLGFSGERAAVLFVGGALTMAIVLVFPAAVGQAADASDDGAGGLIGRIRQIFVMTYVLGLALYATLDPLGIPLPIVGAAFSIVTGLSVMLSRSGSSPTRYPAHAQGRRHDQVAPVRSFGGTRLGVLLVVVTVLLLKGAESLRLVFLPLVVVQVTQDTRLVAMLFAVTVVVEILVLPALGRAGDKYGHASAMLVIVAFGALSCLVIALNQTVFILICAQVLYAIFTAGFQSVGMVFVGRYLDIGAARGSMVYTGLVQLGSITGVVTPLIVMGYQPSIFWIGTAFCTSAILAIYTVQRIGFPRAGTTPPPAQLTKKKHFANRRNMTGGAR